MKKYIAFAAGIATLALTGSAFAADMPAPVFRKAPPPVVAPVYSWTGFYIGLNGGYSWGRSTTTGSLLRRAAEITESCCV